MDMGREDVVYRLQGFKLSPLLRSFLFPVFLASSYILHFILYSEGYLSQT